MRSKNARLVVAASIAVIVTGGGCSQTLEESRGLNNAPDTITKEQSASTTILRRLEQQGYILMPIPEVDKANLACKRAGGTFRYAVVSGAKKAAVMCTPQQNDNSNVDILHINLRE